MISDDQSGQSKKERFRETNETKESKMCSFRLDGEREKEGKEMTENENRATKCLVDDGEEDDDDDNNDYSNDDDSNIDYKDDGVDDNDSNSDDDDGYNNVDYDDDVDYDDVDSDDDENDNNDKSDGEEVHATLVFVKNEYDMALKWFEKSKCIKYLRKSWTHQSLFIVKVDDRGCVNEMNDFKMKYKEGQISLVAENCNNGNDHHDGSVSIESTSKKGTESDEEADKSEKGTVVAPKYKKSTTQTVRQSVDNAIFQNKCGNSIDGDDNDNNHNRKEGNENVTQTLFFNLREYELALNQFTNSKCHLFLNRAHLQKELVHVKVDDRGCIEELKDFKDQVKQERVSCDRFDLIKEIKRQWDSRIIVEYFNDFFLLTASGDIHNKIIRFLHDSDTFKEVRNDTERVKDEYKEVFSNTDCDTTPMDKNEGIHPKKKVSEKAPCDQLTIEEENCDSDNHIDNDEYDGDGYQCIDRVNEEKDREEELKLSRNDSMPFFRLGTSGEKETECREKTDSGDDDDSDDIDEVGKDDDNESNDEDNDEEDDDDDSDEDNDLEEEDDDNVYEHSAKENDRQLASNHQFKCHCSQLIVEVCKALITPLPVDVIVNITNDRLKHGLGIAKVIANTAGEKLCYECEEHISQNGRICVSYHFASSGGNLKARQVYHAVGPKWSDYPDKHDEYKQDLRQAVLRCLLHAEKDGHHSIAFPLISTAVLGAPENIFIESYLKAVQHFEEMRGWHIEERLQKIYFVDMKDSTVNAFKEYFVCNWDNDLDTSNYELRADRRIREEDFTKHVNEV